MIDYLIKFLVGGTIIVLVSFLGKKGNYLLSGIISIAPIITLLSYLIVGNESGIEVLKEVVKNALVFLPITFVYLGIIYLLIHKTKLNVNLSILIAVISWFLIAFLVIKIKSIS